MRHDSDGGSSAPAGSTSRPSMRIVGEPGKASLRASSWVGTPRTWTAHAPPAGGARSLGSAGLANLFEQFACLGMRRAACPVEELDGHGHTRLPAVLCPAEPALV